MARGGWPEADGPRLMAWWGKLAGGTFGFLVGGPLGALLGAALGHQFDAGLDRAGAVDSPSARERAQAAFFAATFAVMGRLAKADGRVSRDELRLATAVMDRMGLGSEQRRVAQRLFTEGKARDFPLDDVLDQLRRECGRSSNLLRMFVEIQLHAVWADGTAHPDERAVLGHVCERLGVPDADLAQLESLVRAELHYRGAGAGPPPSHGPSLEDAYALLGVSPQASDDEVKRAYRRLMSRHHPDKLVAKGLPEEMMRVATEKTQEIKAAWERVKQERDLR